MDKALQFLFDQLNSALKNQFGVTENMVAVGRIKTLDGIFPQENENKLILSVLNISLENERRFNDSRMGFASSGKATKISPLHLNLNVLLAANDSDELEGLKLLQCGIQYFQAHPTFSKSSNAELSEEIDKITIEPYPLSLKETESVWNSLGCVALPSVMYKVRVLMSNIDLSEDTISSVGS